MIEKLLNFRTFKHTMIKKIGLAISLCLISVTSSMAGPANKSIGIDVAKGCNEEYIKIQRILEGASKKTECEAAFSLYKDNMRKCYKEKVGEESIAFPQVSFDIARCFDERNLRSRAREVFQTSLSYPEWKVPGQQECSGHDMLAELLETMTLFEKQPPVCFNRQSLLTLLEEFKNTRDFTRLKKVRSDEFRVSNNWGGCAYPFDKLASVVKEKLKESQISVIPLQNRNINDDSQFFAGIQGFKNEPDSTLVLFFWSDHKSNALPQDENEADNEDDDANFAKEVTGENGVKQKKDPKLPSDNRVSEEPCYYLVSHYFYKSKQEMLEDGFEPASSPLARTNQSDNPVMRSPRLK